jgi:phage/plasmid-associated DNA primase
MLNGGGDFYTREEDTPDWLYSLKLQLREISKKICELNPDLYKIVLRQKEFNPEGTLTNRILCKMENIVLQCMKSFCDNENIKIGALCFDGLLVKNKIEIEKLENYIKSELGIKIKVMEKVMEDGINDEIMDSYKTKMNQEILKEFQEKENIKILKQKEKEEKKREKYEEKREKLGIDFIVSDMEIGKYIMKQIIDTKDFYYDNETNEFYFYNKDTTVFDLIKKESLMKYIHPYAVQYCQEKGIFDVATARLVALSNTKDQKNVLSQMLLYLPMNHDFICRNFNKKRGVYPIKDNKIIDFKHNIIRDRTREDYFTMSSNYTCNLDITDNEVQNCRNWIMEYIIKKERWNSLSDDDNNHIDNFLESLGYVLTGENNLKSMFIWYGPPNTGKSAVKNKCVDEIFQPFCRTLPNQFVCDRTNGLESVHQSHLFPLKYARVGICDELRKNEKPNETDLKKLTGGDREFTVRKAGAPDGTKLHLNLVPIIPTNHDLLSMDVAFNNRKRIVEFVNIWKINDKYIPYSGDFFSVVVKYAHKYYNNNQSIKWSEQMMYSTSKVIGFNDMVKSFFNENFELCETSKIKKDELFSQYQKYCTDNRRTPEGRNSFYDSFKKLNSNIEPHRKLWFKGIKRIEIPESENEDEFEIDEDNV